MLFPMKNFENLDIPGASIFLLHAMDFGRLDASVLRDLIDQIKWEHKDIVVHGRAIKQPRLTAWYGDPGTEYTYSGVGNSPRPWTPLLLDIKARVEALTGASFNSALLNYYRDQRDSIGFHADNEPELGNHPIIASLSLGEERTFTLRPKRDKSLPSHRIALPSGSLLVMTGSTQENWVHGIAKATRELGPRINITFRTIYPHLRRPSRAY